MADQNQMASSIVGIAILGLGAWYFFGGGIEAQAAKDGVNINAQVASDVVDQYAIVKRNGSAADACAQAGLAAAIFLQNKDENNYAQWKKTEAVDCK